MKNLIRAYRLLDASERRQTWILLAVVTVMALFETLGTVSIMPFLAVIANPTVITTNRFLAWVHGTLGFSGTDGFLVFLGVACFVLLIVSAAVRTAGLFFVNRFSVMRTHSIALRLLDTYMRRPYAYFLSRNTGDMAKAMLSEVTMLVSQVFQPATSLLAQSILLLVLLTLLIAVDPVVALTMIGVLAFCYLVIYVSIRSYLERAGRERAAANNQRFRITSEALGGVKVAKLLGRERYYISRFAAASHRFTRLQAFTTTLSQVPRFTIEAVAFGGIILLTLGLMLHYRNHPGGAIGQVLPLLGFYAFAGYRILPAIQGIYGALTQMRFGLAAIDVVSTDLADRDTLPLLPEAAPAPLAFRDAVDLCKISYRYPQAKGRSLHDITLRIPFGSTLGIVGSTGAGKTTLVDLLLGLLEPDEGEMRVDGTPVTRQNVRAWQADLGYVPQDIFLTDASIAENIAFGLPKAKVDMARVRESARLAQILEFVETEVPQGFDTQVGERGVRLSGGQRQRIGIARALYNDPGIIVFDEATSALDNLTEQEVVRAINALTGTKTIVLIAHRISTVRHCDQILVLDHGRCAGIGTYDSLYRDSAAFRRLVDARDVA